MKAIIFGLDLDVNEPRPCRLGQRFAADDSRPHEAHVEAAAPVRGPVVPHAARLALEDRLVLFEVPNPFLTC